MIKYNQEVVEFANYPNGETRPVVGGLKGKPSGVNVTEVRYETDADLFNLLLLKRHCDFVMPQSSTILFLSHMPYARMDRVETPGEQAFTLKYVCDFINTLEFDKVMVSDPHSDVCVALLNNCMMVSTIEPLVEKALEDIHSKMPAGTPYSNVSFVFPDAGAQKKYEHLIGTNYTGSDYFFGVKHRNFANGNIDYIQVHCSDSGARAFESTAFGPAVIVDDLCSRGGTFVGTADSLRKQWGFNEIYLVVAHCEPVAYNPKLCEAIDHVYTTDSMVWDVQGDVPGFTRYNQLDLIQE